MLTRGWGGGRGGWWEVDCHRKTWRLWVMQAEVGGFVRAQGRGGGGGGGLWVAA